MAQHHDINEDELPLSPEEMKAIGEIQLGPSKHEQFLNNHYKKLILLLVVVMLLATAAIVYGTWRARQEADAASTAIAALKVSAPGAAAEASEYDAAQLQEITAAYPGTSAAGTAELLRGMQLVSAGQQDEGLALLSSVATAAADEFLRVRAHVFLAEHYMRSGDAQKAREHWQTVSRAEQTPYLALSLLSLGDMAQEDGDIELARSYYTQVQEKCTSSPLLLTVRQRLLLLGVDAPRPVEPEPQATAPQQPAQQPGWSLQGGMQN